MTIGSLFSGVGGLELGLERAGLGPVLWQAESDAWCRRVLAKHWPEARRYEDVRDVDGSAERVELICGGFPCQDISFAGAGAGLSGSRSGLWWEYLRVLRALRPRWVVVENVAALLARGLDAVLGSLAASGYDASWDCVPAAAVGAPHRRDRLFLVAWDVSDAERDPVRFRAERGQGAARPADPGHAVALDLGSDVANADGGTPPERVPPGPSHDTRNGRGLADAGLPGPEGGVVDGERLRPAQCGPRLADGDRRGRGPLGAHGLRLDEAWDDVDRRDLPAWPPAPGDLHAWRTVPPAAQPAVCRVAHGVPRGLDGRRLKGLGNAVVPQVAEVIGRAIVEAGA